MAEKDHLEKLYSLLADAGVTVITRGTAPGGEPASIELPEDFPQRFDDEDNIVHRDDLIERQMETIDALRGALGAVSRSVEALAGRGHGGGQPAVPPGKTVIDEARLAEMLDKLDQQSSAIEQLEQANYNMADMLRKFSWQQGYDGDIGRDFEKMVSGMPDPGAPKPSRFILPDGTATDQVGTALFEWQNRDPEALVAAQKKLLKKAAK